MNEDTRQRLIAYGASSETLELLTRYVEYLIAENTSQNLIAKSTEAAVWERHIIDSAQLLPLLHGTTADIGSGAGLPGIVIAAFGRRVELIEPRRKRADFLRNVAGLLSLDALIRPFHVEHVKGISFETITARAFSPLESIFQSTIHLASRETRWVLPKGRRGISELEVARRSWHGSFTMIPSVTDPEAVIIVAEDVRPRV